MIPITKRKLYDNRFFNEKKKKIDLGNCCQIKKYTYKV